MNDRAITYRRLNDIPESWGTAVNVQSMVFGNMGESSATGVAFTRDPSTGEKRFYGEYLVNAQGEDVVAGIRTPAPISNSRKADLKSEDLSLEEAMPEVYAQLIAVAERLETHYRDMQDIEFTVEQGKLYMLQTRNGKRTAQAALKLAVEMCREGLITEREAVLRLDPAQLDQLLHPMIAKDAVRDVFVKGLPASPGAAVGQVVFDPAEAVALARERHAGHSGAHRDEPGRHSGHARRQGHRDGARRHDVPRGRRGARHGPAVRLWRWFAADRCGQGYREGRVAHAEEGRHHHG